MRHNCYLEFNSCFFVNLGLLLFHIVRITEDTVQFHARDVAKQTCASYFVAVYRSRGETPTLIPNGYLG